MPLHCICTQCEPVCPTYCQPYIIHQTNPPNTVKSKGGGIWVIVDSIRRPTQCHIDGGDETMAQLWVPKIITNISELWQICHLREY